MGGRHTAHHEQPCGYISGVSGLATLHRMHTFDPVPSVSIGSSEVELVAVAMAMAKTAAAAPGGRSGGRGRARGRAGRGGRGKAGRGRGRSGGEAKPAAPPVAFPDAPGSSSASSAVGIVGGGYAGVALARALADLCVTSTVYDTGEHGVGGRLATRYSLGPRHAVADHACQIITAREEAFRAAVHGWTAAGAARAWDGGRLGDVLLAEGGPPAFRPWGADRTAYVAPGGMRSLAEHVLREAVETGRADVVRPCWVSAMRADEAANEWELWRGDRRVGTHDFVVVAHNGKCANRLLHRSGAPLVHAQMKRLKLNSVWAVVCEFDEPLGAPWDCAFVHGSDVLAMATNQSAKLEQPPEAAGREVWTLLSTAAYGKANKVPQENVPRAKAEQVGREMVEALAEALGSPELPPSRALRTQLWGAALPTNSPGVPCVFDGASRVGIAGDWLLGAGVEAAHASAAAMAGVIARAVDAPDAAAVRALSVGLHDRLERLDTSDVGEFA